MCHKNAVSFQKFRKDILNSIYHILGFHHNCSDFCKQRISDQTENDNEDNKEPSDSFEDLFDNQSEYWKLPSEEENSTE